MLAIVLLTPCVSACFFVIAPIWDFSSTQCHTVNPGWSTVCGTPLGETRNIFIFLQRWFPSAATLSAAIIFSYLYRCCNYMVLSSFWFTIYCFSKSAFVIVNYGFLPSFMICLKGPKPKAAVSWSSFQYFSIFIFTLRIIGMYGSIHYYKLARALIDVWEYFLYLPGICHINIRVWILLVPPLSTWCKPKFCFHYWRMFNRRQTLDANIPTTVYSSKASGYWKSVKRSLLSVNRNIFDTTSVIPLPPTSVYG